MDGLEGREVMNPLLSTPLHAAPASQQVMSPTLRTAFGYGTSESSATPNPPNSGTEGGLGFASDVSKVPRGYMCPCQHRAGAQVYNPPLACQVQVPSAWAGMVKHC